MILSYDANISRALDCSTPSTSRFYGIELEVDNSYLSEEYKNEDDEKGDDLCRILNDDADKMLDACPVNAVAKHDGSLLLAGFEIVTSPNPIDRYIDKMDGMLEVISSMGYSSWDSKRCGIHIHVNKNSLSPFQIAKILAFIYNPANFRFVKTIAQRHNDRYASFSNVDYGKPKRIKYPFDFDRYTAINLHNRNTVEFRMFRGTLLPKRLYKNLEFVDSLIEFTSTCNNSFGDCQGWETYVKYVTLQYKKYPYLYAFLAQKGLLRVGIKVKEKKTNKIHFDDLEKVLTAE